MKTSPLEAARLRAERDRQNGRNELRAKRDTMISSVADTVAQDWFKRCIRNQCRMTLYWRKPRVGESAACPIIDIQSPNDDFTAGPDVLPSMTRDRVAAMVRDAMHNLPMLSAEWFTA